MNKSQYMKKYKNDSTITWLVNTIRTDMKLGQTFEESLATFEPFAHCPILHEAILELVKLRLKKLNLIK